MTKNVKDEKISNLNIGHTTWNLQSMFENDNDPLIKEEIKIIEKKTKQFVNKWRENKSYLEDPKILREALDDYEKWVKEVGTSGKQGYYFSLRNAQDQLNHEVKAKQNKLHEFAVEMYNQIQFFELSLAKIPEDRHKKFLENQELKDYKHYLKKTFAAAKHILSEKEERILNLKAKTSYGNWVRMLSELISKEEREVIDEDGELKIKNFTELLKLLYSKDKKVRDGAAHALEDIFSKHNDVAEREFNNIAEDAKVDDQLRKFIRPDESRHLADDIETEIIDQLVDVVSGKFSLSKEYYKFKASLLDQKSLKYHERAVEYGEIASKYSYEKAVGLVYKTFLDLDQVFADIFAMFVENGHLDVFPAKGKAGGAFCASTKSSLPTYILLNHTGSLNDVLTMAHEVGHGINFELIKKRENELNLDVSTAVAEVASTFMEDFVLQKLLLEADDEERLAIMTRKLDSDMAAIFRQIAFYNFESEYHKKVRDKGYLTKEDIGSLFEKHMISYLGDCGKSSNNWWIYVSHFRRFFYVYSYASGLLISKYLQKKVKQNKENINLVKEAFSIGGSKSPKELFMDIGVDISKKSIWENGISEVEDNFLQAKNLAKKLGKI